MWVLDKTMVIVSITMSFTGHAGVVSSNRNETWDEKSIYSGKDIMLYLSVIENLHIHSKWPLPKPHWFSGLSQIHMRQCLSQSPDQWFEPMLSVHHSQLAHLILQKHQLHLNKSNRITKYYYKTKSSDKSSVTKPLKDTHTQLNLAVLLPWILDYTLLNLFWKDIRKLFSNQGPNI